MQSLQSGKREGNSVRAAVILPLLHMPRPMRLGKLNGVEAQGANPPPSSFRSEGGGHV